MGKNIYGEDQKILRSLLRKLRTDAGFHQEELAKKLGYAQSFVSKYEIGERQLDILELRHICRNLGIPFKKFALTLDALLSRGTYKQEPVASWAKEAGVPYRTTKSLHPPKQRKKR